MKRFSGITALYILLLIAFSFPCFSQQVTGLYFPTAGNWERRKPAEAGFNTTKLQEAITFAIRNESRASRDLFEAHLQSFGKEPFGEAVGPFKVRGNPAGIILRKGYLVAEWGDPARVDMTFSVTKSFLSLVVGLAVDRGLIKTSSDTVLNYVPFVEPYDPARPEPEAGLQQPLLFPFSSDHNRRITWDVLLRQTSDWEGTLWGKPDWADRPDKDSTTWLTRKRNDPGKIFEYNDVRVNALALAATCVWRKPLPQVLKENIMDQIGASGSWRWTGYRNSWIVVDGRAVQSVSGGGHWGGGMFINAYDMARLGLLTMNLGNWNGKQIISENWIRESLRPTPAQPTYGHMNFFLNTERKYYSNAPATAFMHLGNGTNIIYVDPENELVVVARWIASSAINEFIGKLLEAARGED